MDKKTPEIIFQEEGFIVINKVAGMIVNNADTSRNEYTVQDFIIDNFKLSKKESGHDSDFEKRGGIVHRLDKETSGALIVALNEEYFIAFQNQFKERNVKKEYIALCHGRIVEEGEINVPIGRLPWNRMRFGVLPQGRESYTKFKVIKRLTLSSGRNKEELSLVEVYPQSGRTHQIRVHFQYAGHPLFSDLLYGGRKTTLRDRKLLPRHFLHASKISVIHPINNEKLTFDAPLPSDLVDFLAQLT